jgi:hypothetical protein
MILKHFKGLTDRDVRSTSMGDTGSDIKLSEKAFNLFPYDVECKNQERLNIWQAYEQSCVRTVGEPLVIIKRNKSRTLAVVDAEYFVKLHGDIDEEI